MIRVFLLTVCLLLFKISESQTISQTLRYINNNIKTNCWIVEGYADNKAFDQLSLNEDGLLTVQRIITDNKTGKFLSNGHAFQAYIKNLEFGEIEENSFYATVSLVSKNGMLKDITSIPLDSEAKYSDKISIIISNKLVAFDLEKSLRYLLSIANENKNFITGYFPTK